MQSNFLNKFFAKLLCRTTFCVTGVQTYFAEQLFVFVCSQRHFAEQLFENQQINHNLGGYHGN
jgi:hypothetical protein